MRWVPPGSTRRYRAWHQGKPRAGAHAVACHRRRAVGTSPGFGPDIGARRAGSSARAKARSIGIADDKDREIEKREHELRPATKPVRLLGREIRLAATDTGDLLADDKGKPASKAGAPRPSCASTASLPLPPTCPAEQHNEGGGRRCSTRRRSRASRSLGVPICAS